MISSYSEDFIFMKSEDFIFMKLPTCEISRNKTLAKFSGFTVAACCNEVPERYKVPTYITPLDRSQATNGMDKSQITNAIDRSQIIYEIDRWQIINTVDKSQINAIDKKSDDKCN